MESLAKKYEEKYKKTGDVASKLSIEEATFRDIQVIELYILQLMPRRLFVGQLLLDK